VVPWQNEDATGIADVRHSATGEILRLVVWGGVGEKRLIFRALQIQLLICSGRCVIARTRVGMVRGKKNLD
jgi:hypothetical protein